MESTPSREKPIRIPIKTKIPESPREKPSTPLKPSSPRYTTISPPPTNLQPPLSPITLIPPTITITKDEEVGEKIIIKPGEAKKSIFDNESNYYIPIKTKDDDPFEDNESNESLTDVALSPSQNNESDDEEQPKATKTKDNIFGDDAPIGKLLNNNALMMSVKSGTGVFGSLFGICLLIIFMHYVKKYT